MRLATNLRLIHLTLVCNDCTYILKNMKMITWSEEYEMGNEPIDRQHRDFLGLVNDFQTERLGAGDIENLLSLLYEMVLRATFLFSSEEYLMKELGYSELDKHIKQHNTLVKNLTNKITDLQKGGCSPQQVENFLTSWFINHVLQKNKKIPFYA
jgi:hemerythrin-like metal-binding protein